MSFWEFFNPNNTISASSGNVTNANAVATLTPAATQHVYASGIELTGGGASSAALVTATLTGLIGGTLSWTFGVAGTATGTSTPLIIPFPTPLIGIIGTAVVLTLPALGSGNTNACATLHGFIS